MSEEALPPNSLYHIFAERDKDPSRILVELDKGLRSKNVGEQCESILFFTKLLSKFPFPSIVATAFLKLADLYHGTSNNVIRYCIGKVFQEQAQSNTQLFHTKQGEDEQTKEMLLQRLLQPLHSSDPIAKALTLRTLGSMSIFLADDLGMQHSIRNCLSSSNPLEASAAIFAVDGVCERSPIFSKSILPYIAELIQGLRCTPRTKLKLIYVLRHMGHDPEMIHEARELLQRVLQMIPSHIVVLVSLHTLTLLATSSLLYIPQQINLLIEYLDDPRQKIRLLALRDLRRIVEQASHHIDTQKLPIEKFVTLIEQTKVLGVRQEVLLLFRSLTKIFGPVIFTSVETRSKFIKICELFLHEKDNKVCLLAAEVFAMMTNESETAELLHCVSSVFFTVEKFMQLNVPRREYNLRKLVFILASLVKGNQNAETCCVSRFIVLMQSCDINTTSIFVKALNLVLRNSSAASKILAPKLSLLISDFLPHASHAIRPNITAGLAGSIFRSFEEISPSRLAEALDSLIIVDQKLKEQNRGWERFVIARAAACRGYHNYAASVFAELSNNVRMVPLHYWLQSLASLSQGEDMILTGNESLAAARAKFLESLTLLRAARLKNLELNFQEQFLSLRQQFLGLLTGLLGDIPLLVRVGVHTREAYSRQFVDLGQQYNILRRSFLDLDASSMILLETDQIVCCLLSFALDVFLGVSNATPDPVLLQLLLDREFSSSVKKFCAVTLVSLQGVIESKKTFSVQQAASSLTQLIHKMLQTRYCVPQYFFQSKPTSFVQISTNPSSPANGGQPVSPEVNTGVVLKISGIISQASWKKERKVKKVLLRIVTRERFSDHQTLQVMLHPEEGAISTFDQTIIPSNDSFVASTVMTFPQEGKFSVVVQCKIIDTQNVEWLERKNTIIQVFVKPNAR